MNLGVGPVELNKTYFQTQKQRIARKHLNLTLRLSKIIMSCYIAPPIV